MGKEKKGEDEHDVCQYLYVCVCVCMFVSMFMVVLCVCAKFLDVWNERAEQGSRVPEVKPSPAVIVCSELNTWVLLSSVVC